MNFSNNKLRVYYHHPKEHTREQAQMLRDRLDERIELVTGDEAVDFDIVIAGRLAPEVLERSSRLKAVIVPWVGIDSSLREALTAYPHIALHNSHWNASIVAEFAVGLMFAAAKNIPRPDQRLRQGNWDPWDNPALMIGGKQALILGYGKIGQHIAHLCRGLGMAVSAVRRSVTQPIEQDGVMIYPNAALPDLLPTTDFLHIALPLTPETKGLIGQPELDLLPQRAILINVGRGPVVDEVALYQALRDQTLHAAALDVWYTYPTDDEARPHTFPANSLFHELENCVLSPHHAAALYEKEHDHIRMHDLAEMLNDYINGIPLRNSVDLSRGY